MHSLKKVVRAALTPLKPVITWLVYTPFGERCIMTAEYNRSMKEVAVGKIKFRHIPNFAFITIAGYEAELIVTEHYSGLYGTVMSPSIHVKMVKLPEGNIVPLIGMNKQMARAPVAYRDAMLAHEIGHIHHRHAIDANGEIIEDVPRLLRTEHEADLFSQENGFDMIGALKWLLTSRSNYLDFKEIRERILMLSYVVG